MKAAKGALGGRSKLYKAAKETVERGMAVRLPRPQEEEARVPRALDHPHQRGGPAARHELQPRSMAGLRKAGVEMNRKILADLAVRDPQAFGKLADKARSPTQ